MEGASWIWAALGLGFTVMTTMGGYVFKLADRISKAESKADASAKQANGAVARVIELERQVTDHRVAVAKDYVSNGTLVTLENRIVDAINRLGDRIDGVMKAH